MIKDSLGDRMKSYYEEVSRTKLVRRMPVIIRLDGKAFHTLTKGFVKPFDNNLIKAMQETMKFLCENIQGCVLGYTQSDEITLVLTDYAKLTTSAWFDYEVQKICSIAASLATLKFNQVFEEITTVGDFGELRILDRNDPVESAYSRAIRRGALFDARCFNVPKEEVVNCVLWRQQDAERNSVNSLAQSLYSHNELQGIGMQDLIVKMEQEKGVIWGNLPTTQKRGSCCIRASRDTVYIDISPCGGKEIYTIDAGKVKTDIVSKHRWIIDDDIPRFINEGRNYIERLINFPVDSI